MIRKSTGFALIILVVFSLLAGCQPATEPPTEPTKPTEPSKPLHSDLYIEGLAVEDVIRYFNEVCLDAEFVNNGDPSKVQKWVQPIGYQILGTPTEKDREVLTGFASWLNTVEGFPGMTESEVGNLKIHFYGKTEFEDLMGSNFTGTDGGVTFWYNGRGEIYEEIIGYRTDISQAVRNSVILEEIYNGLGPIQDTDLRKDSIIYSGYTTPQSLTEVDKLILKLLYHPDIKCGMNATQCEAVIRKIYY